MVAKFAVTRFDEQIVQQLVAQIPLINTYQLYQALKLVEGEKYGE